MSSVYVKKALYCRMQKNATQLKCSISFSCVRTFNTFMFWILMSYVHGVPTTSMSMQRHAGWKAWPLASGGFLFLPSWPAHNAFRRSLKHWHNHGAAGRGRNDATPTEREHRAALLECSPQDSLSSCASSNWKHGQYPVSRRMFFQIRINTMYLANINQFTGVCTQPAAEGMICTYFFYHMYFQIGINMRYLTQFKWPIRHWSKHLSNQLACWVTEYFLSVF